MPQLYYTVKEVADIFRCSTHTIKRRIDEGVIPTHPDETGLIPRQYVETWDIETKETFRERKLKQELELERKENLSLKNKIREILRIGLEVKI